MTFEKINIEKNAPFDLPHAVGRWCNRLTQSPSLTESDSEELKGHLLDTIDDLKAAGLDDEEAFWVASKRLGVCVSLDEDYETVNRPLIQMRKSLILLAGGFFYFVFYYFLLFSSYLLFIGLMTAGTDGDNTITIVRWYLYGLTVFPLVAASGYIFLLKKQRISFSNIRIRTAHFIGLLLLTVIFATGKHLLYPVVRKIGHDHYIWGTVFDIFFYFWFLFPLVLCLVLILLYFFCFSRSK